MDTLFKNAKVIMLPTKGEANIYFYDGTNRIGWFNEKSRKQAIHLGFIGQHLYITSDDKIEKDDWFHLDMSHSHSLPDEIHQMGDNNWSKTGGIHFCEGNSWVESCRKIIATTDKSLFTRVECHFCSGYGYVGCATSPSTPRPCDLCCGRKLIKQSLPQPSEEFIQYYIEKFNNGNQITDVDVECETLKTTVNNKHFGEGHVYAISNKININHKDNTINIKKVKEVWSREELIQLFEEFGSQATSKQISLGHIPSQFVADKIEIDKFLREKLIV